MHTLLLDSIKSLQRSPPAYIVLLALALSLPAAMAFFATGLKSAETNLINSRQITLFLTDISQPRALALSRTLTSNKNIRSAELKWVDLNSQNIPTIDVHPANTLSHAQLTTMKQELESLTSAEFVATNQSWLERNYLAIENTRKLWWLSIAFAALATMALTALLTRLDLPKQRSEMIALRQMGASGVVLLKPLVWRYVLLSATTVAIGTGVAWGILAVVNQYVDTSTYRHVLPDTLPVSWLAWMVALAAGSSVLVLAWFSDIRKNAI